MASTVTAVTAPPASPASGVALYHPWAQAPADNLQVSALLCRVTAWALVVVSIALATLAGILCYLYAPNIVFYVPIGALWMFSSIERGFNFLSEQADAQELEEQLEAAVSAQRKTLIESKEIEIVARNVLIELRYTQDQATVLLPDGFTNALLPDGSANPLFSPYKVNVVARIRALWEQRLQIQQAREHRLADSTSWLSGLSGVVPPEQQEEFESRQLELTALRVQEARCQIKIAFALCVLERPELREEHLFTIGKYSPSAFQADTSAATEPHIPMLTLKNNRKYSPVDIISLQAIVLVAAMLEQLTPPTA